MKELRNPISAYRITLMNQLGTEIFGWIELMHAGKATGFIYITSEPITDAPHLNSKGTYIVMALPAALLTDLLTILRNERNLFIRFFDPESPGIAASAFLESEGDQPIVGREAGFEDPKFPNEPQRSDGAE
jgi:hypothetical protein